MKRKYSIERIHREIARKDRSLKSIQRELESPLWLYCLRNGVLFMIFVGGPVAFIGFNDQPFSWSILGRQLLLYFLGGLGFGAFMRWFYRKYKKRLSKAREELVSNLETE